MCPTILVSNKGMSVTWWSSLIKHSQHSSPMVQEKRLTVKWCTWDRSTEPISTIYKPEGRDESLFSLSSSIFCHYWDTIPSNKFLTIRSVVFKASPRSILYVRARHKLRGQTRQGWQEARRGQGIRGPCQAQDWSVQRKEDVSNWEIFLAQRMMKQNISSNNKILGGACTGHVPSLSSQLFRIQDQQ
jgi:hypothetical protein